MMSVQKIRNKWVRRAIVFGLAPLLALVAVITLAVALYRLIEVLACEVAPYAAAKTRYAIIPLKREAVEWGDAVKCAWRGMP